MTESPWMTTDEAAVYSRRSVCTIRRHCSEYDSSQGKRGLKSDQRTVPNGIRTIHIRDLERWMRGEAPARTAPRSAVA